VGTREMLPSLANLSIGDCVAEDPTGDVQLKKLLARLEKPDFKQDRARDYTFLIAYLAALVVKKEQITDLSLLQRTIKTAGTILHSLEGVAANTLSHSWVIQEGNNQRPDFLGALQRAVLVRKVEGETTGVCDACANVCGTRRLVEFAWSDESTDAFVPFRPKTFNVREAVQNCDAYEKKLNRFVEAYSGMATHDSLSTQTFAIGTICHARCMHHWTTQTLLVEAMYDTKVQVEARRRPVNRYNYSACFDLTDTDEGDRLYDRVATVLRLEEGKKYLKVPQLPPVPDDKQWSDIEKAISQPRSRPRKKQKQLPPKLRHNESDDDDDESGAPTPPPPTPPTAPPTPPQVSPAQASEKKETNGKQKKRAGNGEGLIGRDDDDDESGAPTPPPPTPPTAPPTPPQVSPAQASEKKETNGKQKKRAGNGVGLIGRDDDDE
jgi:hypothetical protein